MPALIGIVLWSVIFYLVSGDALFWHQGRIANPNRDSKPEARWATGQVIQKLIIMLVLIIMASFGAVAMWSPPSVQPPPPPTRVTYMLTFTFISIPALLMLDGMVYLVSRKQTKAADDRRTANLRRRRSDVNPLPVAIAEQLEREMEHEQ